MESRKIKYTDFCTLFNIHVDYEIYNKEREENILYLNIDYIIKMNDSKRRRLPKCNGCYPVFQCNQIGHIGYHGCLEDNDIFYFLK